MLNINKATNILQQLCSGTSTRQVAKNTGASTRTVLRYIIVAGACARAILLEKMKGSPAPATG